MINRICVFSVLVLLFSVTAYAQFERSIARDGASPIGVARDPGPVFARLALDGETVTGKWLFDDDVRLSAGKFVNWGATAGAVGYGLRDESGQIKFKDSGGSWIALSSLATAASTVPVTRRVDTDAPTCLAGGGDLSIDRTISLSSDCLTSSLVLDGTLLEVDLSATNAPIVGWALVYDAGGGFTWSDPAGFGSSPVWTRSAGMLHPTTLTDDVCIGCSTGATDVRLFITDDNDSAGTEIRVESEDTTIQHASTLLRLTGSSLDASPARADVYGSLSLRGKDPIGGAISGDADEGAYWELTAAFDPSGSTAFVRPKILTVEATHDDGGLLTTYGDLSADRVHREMRSVPGDVLRGVSGLTSVGDPFWGTDTQNIVIRIDRSTTPNYVGVNVGNPDSVLHVAGGVCLEHTSDTGCEAGNNTLKLRTPNTGNALRLENSSNSNIAGVIFSWLSDGGRLTVRDAVGSITTDIRGVGTTTFENQVEFTVTPTVGGTAIQKRVSGTCAAGTGMRAIDETGGVPTCEAFLGTVSTGSCFAGAGTSGDPLNLDVSSCALDATMSTGDKIPYETAIGDLQRHATVGDLPLTISDGTAIDAVKGATNLDWTINYDIGALTEYSGTVAADDEVSMHDVSGSNHRRVNISKMVGDAMQSGHSDIFDLDLAGGNIRYDGSTKIKLLGNVEVQTDLVGNNTLNLPSTRSLGTATQQWNEIFVKPVTGTGTNVVIDSNGQIKEETSRRIDKVDIEDLEPALASLLSELRPVSFKYRSGGGTRLGLIAEEVQSVFPTIVHLDELGKAKSIDYHSLSVLLLLEVRRLNQKFESLTN